MKSQNRDTLREIYEKILNRHHNGYLVNTATLIGNEVVWEKRLVFYPTSVVKKLTGKSPKMLKKWIEWGKK